MTNPMKLLSKEGALKELLASHRSVYVWLDSRRNVCVPENLMGKPQLVLQLGYRMPVPIRDLEIDKSGWSATLSFGGAPFTCVVPWESVYAIVGEESGKGAVWPGDKPSDVDLEANPVDPEQAAVQSAPQGKKKVVVPLGWKVHEGGKTG